MTDQITELVNVKPKNKEQQLQHWKNMDLDNGRQTKTSAQYHNLYVWIQSNLDHATRTSGMQSG